jgi:hypothetical protein
VDEGVVGSQIDFFVLRGFPKTFNEHVVAPAAFTVHVDPDDVFLQQTGEDRAGELAALIGIEDVRFAIFDDRFVICLEPTGIGS